MLQAEEGWLCTHLNKKIPLIDLGVRNFQHCFQLGLTFTFLL